MPDILVISDDVVGERMAGPGIRAWEISKVLGPHFRVTLAIPDYSPGGEQARLFKDVGFEVVRYSIQKPSLLQAIGERSKIILTQGYVLSKFPALKKLSSYFILDMYVPFPLENLFVHQIKVPSLKDREFIHQKDLRVFNEQILCGDHFLCANSRQRDLVIGALMSLNRINPATLEASPSLEDLISVVSFGLHEGEGQKAEEVSLRQMIPQIKEKDILFLWGGVLSNWFDPVTLIQAFAEALQANADLKLLFLSKIHPNPLLPEFDMAAEAVRISKELGLLDRAVFFPEGWVEYQKRPGYFKAADIGVSIHKLHFETYFSFRTRILDYLSFGLPIICTEGDYFAELVRKENLGLVVRPEDRDDLRQAILMLAGDEGLRREMKDNLGRVKKMFFWERVAEPLVLLCQRVLAGEVRKKRRPSRKEIAYFCCVRQDSKLKKIGNRYFWAVLHKLPFPLATRLKRIFKALN